MNRGATYRPILAAVAVLLAWSLWAPTTWAGDKNLVANPAFVQEAENGQPASYQLSGSVTYGTLGNPQHDVAGRGVALQARATAGGAAAGEVSQTVPVDLKEGRWFRFAFRGLPQDNFAVPDDGLFMRVEFLTAGSSNPADGKQKELYPLVRQARHDLNTNGNLHRGGAAVWRDYVLDVYVPFPQVDALKLTVGFSGGRVIGSDSSFSSNSAGSFQSQPMRRPFGNRQGGLPPERIDTAGSSFLVTDFSLTHIDTPAELMQPAAKGGATVSLPQLGTLLPIGGRWFFQARNGQTQIPAVFDSSNADQLLYHDGPAGQYEAPFAGNMGAWLRAGDKDVDGNIVSKDTWIADNVTVRFDSSSMILHTRGLPNHPTGKFPESGYGRGGNPNYIQEQDETFYIPLNPKINPRHIITDTSNSNHALNMGPIGVAVNGVVFFNPFDAGSMDASNAMDRCCGHPNQDGLYHYHKYPVCVNSPWADEGQTHSPLIGWAFDGFPIYGPYESKDVMAKDVYGEHALNGFNIHFDAQRGWHYHVTPGKFPYIIGGYWGVVDSRDVRRPHPGGMGGQGGAMGGPGFGPGEGFPPPPPDGF